MNLNRRNITFCAVLIVAGLVGGCEESSSPTAPPMEEVCGPFPDWKTSPYTLPYPIGTSFIVGQANCSGGGHSGFWRYGYDFLMDIGTPVLASRDGIVVHANDGAEDYDLNHTNLITVRHSDGTVMLYSHLTKGGVLVEVGQMVAQGELIGRSGVTGNTGGTPHLHFSLHPCSDLPGLPGAGSCPAIPMTVSNTDPNPSGLQPNRAYVAQ